jgi:hypothetical protein
MIFLRHDVMEETLACRSCFFFFLSLNSDAHVTNPPSIQSLVDLESSIFLDGNTRTVTV